MKWFKHDTDGHSSEGLAAIRAEFGFEGIGWWYTLLELVAQKMDSTDHCELRLPLREWCKILETKPEKFRRFAILTTQKCKTSIAESEQNRITYVSVSIPNLLKKRDEHTTRLGSKKRATPEQDKEREKENIIIQTKQEIITKRPVQKSEPVRAQSVTILDEVKQAMTETERKMRDYEAAKATAAKQALKKQADELRAELGPPCPQDRAGAIAWLTREFAALIPNCTDEIKAKIYDRCKKTKDMELLHDARADLAIYLQTHEPKSTAGLVLDKLWRCSHG